MPIMASYGTPAVQQQQSPAVQALPQQPQAQRLVQQGGAQFGQQPQAPRQYGVYSPPQQAGPAQYGPPAPQGQQGPSQAPQYGVQQTPSARPQQGGGYSAKFGVAQAPSNLQPTPQQGPWGYQPTPQGPQGQPWQPTQQGPYGGPTWSPQGQPMGSSMPSLLPRMPTAQSTTPITPQSLEQQALAGGTSAQRTQDFLKALQMSGAGGNNTFQNTGGPVQAPQQNLFSAMAGSNGNNGSIGYAGNFGSNPNQVSYNQGLGAQGGDFSYYNLNNKVGQNLPLQGSGNDYSAAVGAFGKATFPPASPNSGPQAGAGNNFATQGASNSAVSMLSDETAKTNIEPAQGRDLQGFLDSVHAWEYEYKDPAHGEGKFVSPMAQELEKTELGKQAVMQTDDGTKVVHYGRLGGVMLAAQAHLNERINDIEAQIRKGLRSKGNG